MTIPTLPALPFPQPLAYALALALCVILAVQWMKRWFSGTHPSPSTQDTLATNSTPLLSSDSRSHSINQQLSFKFFADDGLSQETPIKSILKVGGASKRPAPNTSLPSAPSEMSNHTLRRMDPDDIPHDLFSFTGDRVAKCSNSARELKKLAKIANRDPHSSKNFNDFLLLQAQRLLHTMPVLVQNNSIEYACADPKEVEKLCTTRPVTIHGSACSASMAVSSPSPLLPNLIPFILLHNIHPCGVLFDLRNKCIYSYDPSHFYHDKNGMSYFSHPKQQSAIEQELRHHANDDSLSLSDFSHFELSPASPFQHQYVPRYTYAFLIDSLLFALGNDMENPDHNLDGADFHRTIIQNWQNTQHSYPRCQYMEQQSQQASDGDTPSTESSAHHAQPISPHATGKRVTFQLPITP